MIECLLTVLAGLGLMQPQDVAPTTRPFVVGHLREASLRESSGIVESRRHPGVFWTHNDSGNAPVLYAVRRDGSLVNAFQTRCVALDWEDIAIDEEGHIYLGDIGNNGQFRGSIGVLRFDEPDPFKPQAEHERLEPTRRWALAYESGQRFDGESLLIWKGHGYVIRKSGDERGSTLWRFSLDREALQPLQHVATLPLTAWCTGADLSADGDALAVMSSNGPYLFTGLGGELAQAGRLKPRFIAIPPRTNEAICFTSGGLLGTSEARDVYFFPFESFRSPTTIRRD